MFTLEILCIVPSVKGVNRPEVVLNEIDYIVCVGWTHDDSAPVSFKCLLSNPIKSVGQMRADLKRHHGRVHDAQVATVALFHRSGASSNEATKGWWESLELELPRLYRRVVVAQGQATMGLVECVEAGHDLLVPQARTLGIWINVPIVSQGIPSPYQGRTTLDGAVKLETALCWAKEILWALTQTRSRQEGSTASEVQQVVAERRKGYEVRSLAPEDEAMAAILPIFIVSVSGAQVEGTKRLWHKSGPGPAEGRKEQGEVCTTVQPYRTPQQDRHARAPSAHPREMMLLSKNGGGAHKPSITWAQQRTFTVTYVDRQTTFMSLVVPPADTASQAMLQSMLDAQAARSAFSQHEAGAMTIISVGTQDGLSTRTTRYGPERTPFAVPHPRLAFDPNTSAVSRFVREGVLSPENLLGILGILTSVVVFFGGMGSNRGAVERRGGLSSDKTAKRAPRKAADSGRVAVVAQYQPVVRIKPLPSSSDDAMLIVFISSASATQVEETKRRRHKSVHLSEIDTPELARPRNLTSAFRDSTSFSRSPETVRRGYSASWSEMGARERESSIHIAYIVPGSPGYCVRRHVCDDINTLKLELTCVHNLVKRLETVSRNRSAKGKVPRVQAEEQW
ncbi:hypothetical protein C8Q74DRAFT_1220286 [Fomes fomentarius]|nr:hypothetical protein C8Q74DRAFT_1220286 [Fomes fomentarius]